MGRLKSYEAERGVSDTYHLSLHPVRNEATPLEEDKTSSISPAGSYIGF